jgi:hypothetical protein
MGGDGRVTMTKRELMEKLDRAYWAGHDNGLETARGELRNEIRDELEDEINAWDPDCPLCLAHKKAREDRDEIDRLRMRLEEAVHKNRGWAIRNGRVPYRDTRFSPPRAG